MQWIKFLSHNFCFAPPLLLQDCSACFRHPRASLCMRVCLCVCVRAQYLKIEKPSYWPGWLATEARPYSTAPKTPVPNHWALISSYRHGACGQRKPGFQSPSCYSYWRPADVSGKSRVKPALTLCTKRPKILFHKRQGSPRCVMDWSF